MIPRARAKDPLSSFLAAEKAQAFISSHKEIIVDALNVLSQGTAKEISDYSGLTVEQVDRRTKELRRDERIQVAICNNAEFVRDGYQVHELCFTDDEREDRIKFLGKLSELFMKQGRTKKARNATMRMTGLIQCRSKKQIRGMEKEKDLL